MGKSEAEQLPPLHASASNPAGERLAVRRRMVLDSLNDLVVFSLIKPTISKLSCFALHEARKGILTFPGLKDLRSDFTFITLVLYHFNSG